jgi:hypothetical protein
VGTERNESEDISKAGPSLDPARPKLTRTYALCLRSVYSLREAALRLGLPEGMLRRAILLEDDPAMSVDDDRHYLIAGRELRRYVEVIHPSDRSVFQCCNQF